MSNAWEIQDALLDAIHHEQLDLVVDLSEVRFMDAQLLRALIRARSQAAEREIAFVVVPPTDPTVSRVASLADFDIAA